MEIANHYAKKIRNHIIILWSSILGSAGIIILLFIILGDNFFTYIFFFLSLLVLFFMQATFRIRIQYFDMQLRYHTLLSKSEEVEKTNCRFDSKWLEKFRIEGYNLHIDNDNFTIFYKVSKSKSNKILNRSSLLEIVTIIKNANLDFYHDSIDEEYKKINMISKEIHKAENQVIIQFKKYDVFDKTHKEELDKIISYKEKKFHIVSINCGYFYKSNTLYYLHSNNYYPNRYYQYAVEQIKKITS